VRNQSEVAALANPQSSVQVRCARRLPQIFRWVLTPGSGPHLPLRWVGLLLLPLLFELGLPQLLRADTVQLSLHDGRISIVADRATAAQILQAWGRQGDVTIVNADSVPAVPLTLRLDEMPEEQALDVLLRSAGGYLARRRESPASGSVFDRIVITPTASASTGNAQFGPPAAAPPPAAFPPPPPPVAMPASAGVAAQPSFPAAAAPPQGIPVSPGVVRLVGPDGQPLADDQGDAPVFAQPSGIPYNAGPQVPGAAQPPVQLGPQQPTPQPPSTAPGEQQPSTSAPPGVPRPGMDAPAPNEVAPSPGQPRR
jgi:hypothetical protein